MKTKLHFLWTSLVLGVMQGASAQPIITQGPQNQAAVAGTAIAFTVDVTGAKPLSYQWRSHTTTSAFTNIPFGTEATLVLTNAEYTTRRFSVMVTNVEGATSSIPLASITWLLAISTQPADQIADAGATVTFIAAAIGTAPLAYQWRFNGADLAGQTNRSLVLANAQQANAGHYHYVVTNSFGSLTSRVALLTLSTVDHHERIVVNPDHTISLKMEGVVPRLFAPYYDLYPINASTNLLDWSPLGLLQRTNAILDALSYRDSDATNFDQRFYQTPTNFFITPLPKPSGPYPVGTFSRLLTDPSRTNRYGIPTNSSFMVTFWYPAEPRAGVLLEPYVESNATLYAYLNERNPSVVAKFVSHAFLGLPMATNQINYPVVIYSHGGGFRRQNTDKALELASHGYVVVSVDHEWTTASVFPNGQVLLGTAVCNAPKTCFQPTLASGMNDYRFVLEELARLNNSDALFVGRLDLERLGAIGFSLGCVPVAEFCRIDARCKAVVLLDGGPLLEAPADLIRLGLEKPFLSMNSGNPVDRPPSPAGYNPEWLYASLVLFTNSINHAFWCQIQDATHQSFQDRGSLISDPTRMADPTAISREQSRTIRACTLSFFNKYLKEQDDHLLENPAAVHPNLINFMRK